MSISPTDVDKSAKKEDASLLSLPDHTNNSSMMPLNDDESPQQLKQPVKALKRKSVSGVDGDNDGVDAPDDESGDETGVKKKESDQSQARAGGGGVKRNANDSAPNQSDEHQDREFERESDEVSLASASALKKTRWDE